MSRESRIEIEAGTNTKRKVSDSPRRSTSIHGAICPTRLETTARFRQPGDLKAEASNWPWGNAIALWAAFGTKN